MQDLRFPETFLSDALTIPVAALSYELGRRIAALRPGKAVLETAQSGFEFGKYLAETDIPRKLLPDFHAQIARTYCDTHKRIERTIENACYEIQFASERIEVLVLSYSADDVSETRHFLIGDRYELLQRFFKHVSEWANEVRSELLVFENSSFRKDEELFAVIQRADLDSLVLKGSLKDEIVQDVTSFFARKAVYEKYGLPHKRGILFYGPPGNGKTHLLKGLVRKASVPCAYVRSIQGGHTTGHELLRRVFSKARAIAPCVLVFEDLETIVTDENRSFFLNELDGFHNNSGILTLATTNFPERIDPAIVDRPSRFDRKYFLDLPATGERARFLANFSHGLLEEMQLSETSIQRVAQATSGFSFAYLKELTLSCLMSYVEKQAPGSMGDIAERLAVTMQEQVRHGKSPKRTEGRRVGLVPEA